MFTDKTGTLTENEMQFRECSINGTKYREVNGKLVPEGMTDNSPDGSAPHLVTHIYTHYIHVLLADAYCTYTLLSLLLLNNHNHSMIKLTSNIRGCSLLQAIHVINKR